MVGFGGTLGQLRLGLFRKGKAWHLFVKNLKQPYFSLELHCISSWAGLGFFLFVCFLFFLGLVY